MRFHSPEHPNTHSFHTWMLSTDTEIYSSNKGIGKGPQISHCMLKLSCVSFSHKCRTQGL